MKLQSPLCPSMSSPTPIIAAIANRLPSGSGAAVDPNWDSLTPMEQMAIQLWVEQALNQLRSALDAEVLKPANDSAALLITFIKQLEQALNHSQFRIESAAGDGQAWPIGGANTAIGWLVLAQNGATGWLAEIQLTFIERAIAQLNMALQQAAIVQQAQSQMRSLQDRNQELTQISQLKSEFLANTSHEIRTPLSSILGFTHLMREQGFSPDNQRHQEYLRIILSSGQHLLALINDILDLSKIEANQMDLQWAETELEPLCKTALTLVKEKANDKGLALRLAIASGADRIQADPLRLKQMLFNLMSNGIKFTETGSVGLRLEPDGQYLRFTVWDTGAGIAPEQQALLFRAYSQLPQDEANRSVGTGLGLALTQKLAELHGGWIEVTSTLGEGSAFTIVLPFAPATAIVPPAQKLTLEIASPKAAVNPTLPQTPTPEITAPPSRKIHRSDRNYHVLLIEDHAPNARLIITYLCKLGYEVTWAQNHQKMWQSLAQSVPAMILMDINLPDIDGLSLIRQLRQDDRYADLPIIAQTAMAMTGDRETCLAAGADEYISKPIDLDQLAKTLRQYSNPAIK
jgi:signal transduction histidine kinase/ActR/RegA family two-component response regulator